MRGRAGVHAERVPAHRVASEINQRPARGRPSRGCLRGAEHAQGQLDIGLPEGLGGVRAVGPVPAHEVKAEGQDGPRHPVDVVDIEQARGQARDTANRNTSGDLPSSHPADSSSSPSSVTAPPALPGPLTATT